LDALASAVIGVPGKAQTAVIPGGIARICNAAWRGERGTGECDLAPEKRIPC